MKHFSALPFAILACMASLPSLMAAEWPQFLGPTRNGISQESNLIDTIPTGGLKEVWRTTGGIGMSGIAVGGGRVITLIQKDGQQWLIALQARTGKPQWKTPVASEYKDRQGDGPRATPTISGDRVFAFSGEGTLAAVSPSDGKILWSHNVVKQHSGEVADYGMASSPLVVGDMVIVTAGAPKACVVAYRTGSGERAWAAGDDPPGYSSPALLNVGGRQQVVVFTGGSAIGLDPPTGKLLWRYPYKTDYDCNVATAIEINGNVLISSGENHGTVLLNLQAAGEKFEPKEVWSSQGVKSVLRSEWQTPIFEGGKLYGLDNIGSAGPVTNLTCLDAATGQQLWEKPRFGKSNLIYADGKLFFSTLAGELVIVRASPQAFEELGRQQILGSTRQAPSLADGHLYLRDDKEIVCLDVRKMN
jgi:outer membrane protein assembly factor BamB